VLTFSVVSVARNGALHYRANRVAEGSARGAVAAIAEGAQAAARTGGALPPQVRQLRQRTEPSPADLSGVERRADASGARVGASSIPPSSDSGSEKGDSRVAIDAVAAYQHLQIRSIAAATARRFESTAGRVLQAC